MTSPRRGGDKAQPGADNTETSPPRACRHNSVALRQARMATQVLTPQRAELGLTQHLLHRIGTKGKLRHGRQCGLAEPDTSSHTDGAPSPPTASFPAPFPAPSGAASPFLTPLHPQQALSPKHGHTAPDTATRCARTRVQGRTHAAPSCSMQVSLSWRGSRQSRTWGGAALLGPRTRAAVHLAAVLLKGLLVVQQLFDVLEELPHQHQHLVGGRGEILKARFGELQDWARLSIPDPNPVTPAGATLHPALTPQHGAPRAHPVLQVGNAVPRAPRRPPP